MIKLIGTPLAVFSVMLMFIPYNIPFYPITQDGVIPYVDVDGLFVSHLPEARGAACKVELPGGGHGSGVGFRRVGNVTHILTAKHVVELAGKGADLYIRFTQQTAEIRETVKVGSISKKYDLAVLFAVDSYLKVIPLDVNFNYKLSADTEVMSFGFPLDIFPIIVSVGVITSATDDYIEHDATIFFGNSGGALINVKTGKIIGINVMIRGRYGEARGDEAIAVCIYRIIDFINTGA